MRTPNEYIRAGIQAYNAIHRFAPPVEGHYVPVIESEARRIARAYDRLPVLSRKPGVQLAYSFLAVEIKMQYDFARGYLGITFEPSLTDPYQDSAEMMRDVRENRRMKVYAGESAHPFLSHSEQVWFRGIHDLFGHAAEGYQFGPRGEHNAWIHHSMMFSRTAQEALTTETRGQNSWVNYGPHSHLPVRERPFAIQKAAILPLSMCEWRKYLVEVAA